MDRIFLENVFEEYQPATVAGGDQRKIGSALFGDKIVAEQTHLKPGSHGTFRRISMRCQNFDVAVNRNERPGSASA
jgi:hypothetical protein